MIKMFYIGTRYEKTAKKSIVNIPIATIFEKTGTFIYKGCRLQKFYKAIKPPTNDIFIFHTGYEVTSSGRPLESDEKRNFSAQRCRPQKLIKKWNFIEKILI